MEKVSIASLLEAGGHYGHQSKKWNPKMETYILRKRGDIHIIDLKKTLFAMDEAFSFVQNVVAKSGTVLFVGTKKQAQDAIVEQATRCGMPYVNARWLGGMLTNFDTIRNSVREMERLEAMEEDGTMDSLTKKEQILLRKQLAKLQTNLNGIRNMKKLPDVVFIIDTTKEEIAVKEACKLSIPIVGTIDTNSNPDVIDYGIPINDDAIKAVELVCEFVAEAVLAGSGAVTAAEMEAQKKKDEEKEKAKELIDAEAKTIEEVLAEPAKEEKAEKDIDNSANDDAKEEK